MGFDPEGQGGKPLDVALVNDLRLEDFRNYSKETLELSSGHNLFVGKNGQGKSNLLEAIYALATTRSFRGSKDQELIRHAAGSAKIGASIGEEAVGIRLDYPRGGRRSAYVFEQRLPRVHDLVGRLPAVCFSSADLAIVAGEPADRRRFLDTEISLFSPAYLKAFATYKRALEQRNAALRAIRESGGSEATLDPWETQLSHSGALLRQIRAEFVGEFAPTAQGRHRELSGGAEELEMRFAPSDQAASDDELAARLFSKRSIDIAAGMTTAGPHRDDLSIEINGTAAREYGSQGQQRTAVLAIKLSLAAYWRDQLGRLPILLLDDIMSDLDEQRRAMVMEVSGSLGQVVITATDVQQVQQEVRSGARVFRVEAGSVEAV